MAGLKQKLDHFTGAVLSEAMVERDAILHEVEQARRKALSAAEASALDEAEEYIRMEQARIRAGHSREISQCVQEYRRRLAIRREEIAGQVFDQVRQRLEDYTNRPAYAGRLVVLFREALSCLGGDGALILFLRPRDMAHSRALSALAGRRSVETRPGTFLLGGLILECPARHLRADQTFDQRFAELRSSFAGLAGLSLDSLEDGGYG